MSLYTRQTVNQVVSTLVEKYGVTPGIVRQFLRETNYSPHTSSGNAKFSTEQMRTIWGDFDKWVTNRKSKWS